MISDCPNFTETISCSWAATVPKGTVVFGSANDPNEWDEEGGIVHVINEENFIYLEKVDDEPCKLEIKLRDPFAQIRNISVVSEAKLIEIYGKYGEYIKTCKCEYISEDGERKFYGTQTDLLTSQEITIKFPGAKEGIWLCGVKILLMDAPPSITTSFDLNLVDDKLKHSNIPITEKAEKFKKFLQDYAASKYTATTNVDPHMFLKMMEGECISHLRPMEAAGRNISKYLSSFIPNLMSSEKDSPTDVNKEAPEVISSDQEKAPNSVKEYVDERIQKLEERLEENFSRQLKELESKQNEKLDSILALLKSSALR